MTLSAAERVSKALDVATRYTGGMAFGETEDGHLSFADIRTLIQAAELNAELVRALEAQDEVRRIGLLNMTDEQIKRVDDLRAAALSKAKGSAGHE